MKKLRLVAIGAILFLSASAFNKAAHTQKMDSRIWHLKNGATVTNNPANYEPAGSESCEGSDQVCEITDVAGSNPNQPALSFGDPSSNLSSYQATLRASE